MSAVLVLPLAGMPELTAGDDLAALLLQAAERSAQGLHPGDVLVVTSKALSKVLDLAVPSATDREALVLEQSRRVLVERRVGADGITRVVESLAGPVMAAAGIDGSNTGAEHRWLLLPGDPDGEARRLREALLAARGWSADTALAVIVSDTAGRAWRAGLVDFALGAAGIEVFEDHRGDLDADCRPLAVTTRAIADELATAADLVKGKVAGIPAAIVRGLAREFFAAEGDGARALVRTGRGDWFALGHVEAVRSALGAPPGSAAARDVGIPSDSDGFGDRVHRVIALALLGCGEVAVDLELAQTTARLTASAVDERALGRVLARLEVAASSEGLTVAASEDTTLVLTDGTEVGARARFDADPDGGVPPRAVR